MRNAILIMIAAVMLCLPSTATASDLPDGFAPTKQDAFNSLNVETRLTQLEIAVAALEGRMSDVEKIANEDYIRKLVKEVVTTELKIRMPSGQVKSQMVTYAGYGSFEIPPGGRLLSVDGVPVGQPTVSNTFMGQPSNLYSTPTYQYRVQQPVAASAPTRMWIRQTPRVSVQRTYSPGPVVSQIRANRAAAYGTCTGPNCR